jgi:hypothetical protein
LRLARAALLVIFQGAEDSMTPKHGLRFLLVLTILSSPGCSGIPRRNGIPELAEKTKEKPEQTDFAQLERELSYYSD